MKNWIFGKDLKELEEAETDSLGKIDIVKYVGLSKLT